jgi:hypothetical protein
VVEPRPASARPREDRGSLIRSAPGLADPGLEESYRGWLRLLPAWYRRDREEEMVATFMEAAGSAEDAENAAA